MGTKGDKQSQDGAITAGLVVDKLSSIMGITTKKMFGGHGIFHNGNMFGIVDSKGAFYLKGDDSFKSKFESAGSHRHGRMPYFSVPGSIFEAPERLLEWAQDSIAIAGNK